MADGAELAEIGGQFIPYGGFDKDSPEAKIMRRTKAVWTEAKNTYQIHEPHDFKLAILNHASMSRLHSCDTVGAVGVMRNTSRGKPLILLRINKSAMEQNLDRVLNDVIPHEIAHVVCMLRPQHGHSHNHDDGWKAVAKRLGGTGLAHYPTGAFDL